VVYEFAPSRAGEHARAFLGEWRGKLVCDDYSAYKAGFELGITEIGCAAHARRKFFELHANHKSQIAEQALFSVTKSHACDARVLESVGGCFLRGCSVGLQL
jgi:Transposase IS66 family